MSKQAFEQGFLKRAQEQGLPNSTASRLLKAAEGEEPTPGLKSKDFLNPGLPGGLADYLSPSNFGSARAGKAKAMAESMGDDPQKLPYSIKRPSTSYLLSAFGGMAGGAVLGAGAGGLYGALNPQDSEQHKSLALLGGMLGGEVLGGVGGAVANRSILRGHIKDISKRFDTEEHDPNKIKGATPYNAVQNLLGYLSGPHRQGQELVKQRMLNPTDKHEQSGANKTNGWVQGLSHVPYAGLLAPPIGMTMQNAAANRMHRENNS